jgi:hypothetical protein
MLYNLIRTFLMENKSYWQKPDVFEFLSGEFLLITDGYSFVQNPKTAESLGCAG